MDEFREAEVERLMEGLEYAWAVIANGKAWDDSQRDEWEVAKFRYRDEHWHPALDRNRRSGEQTPPTPGRRSAMDDADMTILKAEIERLRVDNVRLRATVNDLGDALEEARRG